MIKTISTTVLLVIFSTLTTQKNFQSPLEAPEGYCESLRCHVHPGDKDEVKSVIDQLKGRQGLPSYDRLMDIIDEKMEYFKFANPTISLLIRNFFPEKSRAGILYCARKSIYCGNRVYERLDDSDAMYWFVLAVCSCQKR